jgi:hypothetical protein
MAKRQYSDNDKALALATLDANGGDVSKTAKQLKIPRQTLQEWAHNRNINKDVPDLRQVKKKELAEKLDEVAHALADNLLIRAGSELSIFVPMKDMATSLGIVIDKKQLLKGEPTNITKDVSLTPAQRRLATELRRKRGEVQSIEGVQ